MNHRRSDAQRKSDRKEGWLALLFISGFFLVIGGCCSYVIWSTPYNPNWRNNPKYDNYDTPLSPDNNGYGRPR
jgi:hypothetical protein